MGHTTTRPRDRLKPNRAHLVILAVRAARLAAGPALAHTGLAQVERLIDGDTIPAYGRMECATPTTDWWGTSDSPAARTLTATPKAPGARQKPRARRSPRQLSPQGEVTSRDRHRALVQERYTREWTLAARPNLSNTR